MKYYDYDASFTMIQKKEVGGRRSAVIAIVEAR